MMMCTQSQTPLQAQAPGPSVHFDNPILCDLIDKLEIDIKMPNTAAAATVPEPASNMQKELEEMRVAQQKPVKDTREAFGQFGQMIAAVAGQKAATQPAVKDLPPCRPCGDTQYG